MSDWVQCPYNPRHMFTKDRFVFHVTKCQKNYPGSTKVQCPYNSVHILENSDYIAHVLNQCEQRPPQEELKRLADMNYTNNPSPPSVKPQKTMDKRPKPRPFILNHKGRSKGRLYLEQNQKKNTRRLRKRKRKRE
jgi:hypothetical protein